MTFKNKIEKVTSKSQSNWIDKVRNRKNRPWLREYSSEIARRILVIIKNDKDLSQTKLADSLNIKPQQISKIVKGQENLTLETIYKLSQALNYNLISFPPYEYNNKKEVEITVSSINAKSNSVELKSIVLIPQQMIFANSTQMYVTFNGVASYHIKDKNQIKV